MATKTESISIADLELQHRGGDLRDPEEPVAAASTKVHHTVVSHLQAAAVPRFKLLVAGFSLFCAGANDGTLGPLIPYIINTFHIGTGEVAIIYGTKFTGWFVAAATNPVLTVHLTLGQLLAVGAGLALFCITFLQSLGMAYQDTHANTFVSGIPNIPHRWLGFIHGCYALGCFVGPLIATGPANTPATTAVVEGWRMVYFVLIGIGVVNMAGVAMAFKDSLWGSNRLDPTTAPTTTTTNSEQQQPVQRRSKRVVEFLTTVRGGSLSEMGYVPTGFCGGLLAGRLLLAEPSFRLGERRMLLVYSAVCVGLQLVFWLQPNTIASAVALSLMGFFSGPFFASGMSVTSKLFPRKSQPAALGECFSSTRPYSHVNGCNATKNDW
ncbi:hypothetical protein PG995_007212 [Apiospora arundinis]